uniref:Putative conserved proteinconserved plasma membrane protein n=1 Tax=Ixodes ricinus TaxID=34613 RepID=A0A147BGI0_IXORI
MTRVSNARRNFAKSGGSKAVMPTDDRSGPLGGHDPLSTASVLKHVQMPDVPVDGELVFEAISVVFVAAVLCCQYINLYRTVWWLPHSYNNQALNYYLIDVHVATFSVVIACRRFPLAVLKSLLWLVLPGAWYPRASEACRSVVLAAAAAMLLWCSYHICLGHGLLSLLCLAYPAVIYAILFGPKAGPLTELVPVPPRKVAAAGPVPGSPTALVHVCSPSPGDVRAEVELHKRDLNERLKRVLFNTLVVAYYTSFQPCCFVQSQLQLELWWVVQHGVLSWLGALTLHAAYCFPPQYLDALHRSALHLGRWRRLEPRNVHAPHHIWSENVLWPQNNLVKHSKEYFKAEGISNAAEPGNMAQSRFYTIFHSPLVIMGGLLTTQVMQIVFELYLLLKSSEWHRLLTITLFVMLNSVTLFKLARQYFVMERIYHAERIVQETLLGG